ncbi:30S ribosomal protein S2 [Candidatus Roizmanbacteria bacterium RIFCSPLOWO2_01_FULL_42_14]|uniref:Small ribosomal subunit protein uS2 n=4 Tax=Candidatus Roizmaniibacteriota TaxID=1752723 RepID=A0A1F7JTG7_9BACT|nr:MAG: 30S ribosomal protein S2 [Candidatus Roizmanbacteria bacterium RIFCSPHIGHO2_02_FULL_43_11]OGK38444.1 MAG: 30S ribosomal protein S2 [Candidatus Roizmanbacteria bacterium RIFCSPHIGHO2_12_FULL_42_10]OGK51471.1 MAG: 30S ribosomal protein S2 [Candidatus Roizmanbacteria bacterium RIFCSPLOWO2_01_FULL_42_14]OGK58882.1 MAG: 30S ribosomal protein S2 [Candidatus Roizmanbacteria bacterium RIFCSPLOWO2_02_FULL_43_10]
MRQTDPSQLLAHGLHLGHQKNKVHPKAKVFIHSYQHGTSVIDLIQTASQLDKAKEFVSALGKEGKILLVIATKKVAKYPVSEVCIEHSLAHLTNKWVGGFLTNFPEVSKNIKRMNDLRKVQADGSWGDMPKHERTQLEKKLNKVSSIYGGVEKIEALPDAIFIIDIKKEKGSLKEANMLGIPVVAVVDTNVSPDDVTYPIPANDDAIASITFVMKEIAQAYTGGKTKPKAKKPLKATS